MIKIFNTKFLERLKKFNLAGGFSRQRVLLYFLVGAGVFFAIYWTNLFFQSKRDNLISESQDTYLKISKIVEMRSVIESNNSSVRNVQTGLLSFVQSIADANRLGGKLSNLRPIQTTNELEHIALRIENLNYSEFINFISEIERYDNIRIRSLNLNPRYDNDKLIDINMEVVKL